MKGASVCCDTLWAMARLRLATIVYATLDGADSADGDASAATRREIGRRGESMLCDATTQWGGDVVKRLGDGVLATFGRSSDAVMAAVAIEQRLARDRRRHGDASVGSASIGISVGEITQFDGDVAGLPVVEAARLAGVAEAGSILGSPHLPKLWHSSDDVDFRPQAPIELRGFDKPVRPVQIDWGAVGDIAARTPLPDLLVKKLQGFVGRVDEIERLLAFAGIGDDDSPVSGARLATIAGEPGVGKTSLVASVAHRLRDAGSLIIVGRSSREGITPYQPFREALYDLASRHPRGEAVFAAQRTELASILDPDHSTPGGESRADARLATLYDAMVDLFEQLSEQLPVVLVLDDVQWLDQSSLRLVQHLIEACVDRPLMTLMTARPAELVGSGVTDMLRDVARTVASQRYELGGLSTAEVADLAGAGHDSARIHERTGGNPFLVRELLTSGSSPGDASTFRAKSLVTARLNRLPDEARKLLTIAAVQGRRFNPAIVAQCWSGDEDAALDHLDDAIAAGLLGEGSGQGLDLEFAHDLLREALLDELSGLRRARLHKRLGEAMAEQARPDTFADIARHFAAASSLGDRAIACRYHLLAGDHALNVDAPELALDWFARASEYADDEHDQVSADIGRGRALRAAGSPEAREAFHAAADRAHGLRDAEGMARALLADYRGTFGIAFSVDTPRVDRLRTALELAGPDPTPVRARLLASLAVELVWAEDWTEAIALADDALAVAEEAAASEDVRAEVLALRQWVIYHPTETRRRDTDELRRLVDVGGDMAQQFEVAGHAFFTELRTGDRTAALAAMDLARWLAERIDEPLIEWMLTQRESCLAMVESRFEDAHAWIGRASELGATTNQPDAGLMFAVQSFWLEYETADLQEQRTELVRAVAGLELFPVLAWPAVAFRCHEVGLTDEAKRVYAKIAERDFAFPRDQIWLWTMCQAAPLAAAYDADRVPWFIEQLTPHRAEFANMVFSTVGPVARSLGLLRGAVGDHDGAIADLELALSVSEKLHAAGWSARVRLDLADALRAAGSPDRIEELRSVAERDAELLGMPLVAGRARGH